VDFESHEETGKLADDKFVREVHEWVKDTPQVRAYHGKTLHVVKGGKDFGVFTMRVSETTYNGKRNPGHVIVGLEICDTQSALSVIKDMEPCPSQPGDSPVS
jgi:hypothetical protein